MVWILTNFVVAVYIPFSIAVVWVGNSNIGMEYYISDVQTKGWVTSSTCAGLGGERVIIESLQVHNFLNTLMDTTKFYWLGVKSGKVLV